MNLLFHRLQPAEWSVRFSLWAVNAKHLGTHDMGLALFFSYVAAAALVGSLYAAPALAFLVARRCLSSGAPALGFSPLAVVMWLE